MSWVFVFISLIGLAYFLLVKRAFDFLALGYFCACAYFLPGFVGYVRYPPGGLEVPLEEGAFGAMCIVLTGIIFAAVVHDRIESGQTRFSSGLSVRSIAKTLLLFSAVGLLLTILTTGASLLDTDKASMLKELNRWHILWTTASVASIVFADAAGARSLRLWSLALLIGNLYIGFRSPIAFGALSILMLRATSEGPIRILRARPILLVSGLLLTSFLFAYKGIFVAVKDANWSLVQERASDPEYYLNSLTASEPFGTQAILNEVVRTSFEASPQSLVGALLQVLAFAPELGAEIVSFNEQFQPLLFPQANYGMAGNIWAQMLATGGWLLLVTFVALYSFSLAAASRLMRRFDSALRSAAAVFLTPWCLFIHRNDLIYQFSLQKRYGLILLLAGATVWAIRSLTRRRAGGRPGSRLAFQKSSPSAGRLTH